MKYLLMSLVCALLSMPASANEASLSVQEQKPTLAYEISVEETEIKTDDYYVNFGRTRIGERRSAVFTLRNNSSIPIIVQDIDIDGEGFNGGDNCPRFLTRGDRCQIRVTFRPRDQKRYTGQVDIELSGREDIRIHLRGRGVWWN